MHRLYWHGITHKYVTAFTLASILPLQQAAVIENDELDPSENKVNYNHEIAKTSNKPHPSPKKNYTTTTTTVLWLSGFSLGLPG